MQLPAALLTSLESANGFDKDAYLKEIVEQKTKKLKSILMTVVSSRQTYEEFKTNDKLKSDDLESIGEDLESNELERFYKFFDMKTQFNKSYLTKLNLSKEKLVTTKWFKTKIKETIK